jgi:hypothetical protein
MMRRYRWPGTRRETVALLILFFLGLVFFVDHAHLELATDDIGWLQGQAPTVFDRYREIPRFFFVALHAIAGSNALAALTLIFAFHCLNTLLVYILAHRILADPIAALAAAGVFLINPITLSTLTWISCFSYVLGTSLALLSLLAFWRANEPQPTNHKPMVAIALACFGVGLFCTHEIFFLPVVFGILGWYQGQPKQGITLFAAAMALALLVNTFVYDFGRYGVEASRLFTSDFVLAYVSSAQSSGLALALAYPLSFLCKTLNFLSFCFAEPVRWGMTLMLLAVYVQFSRNTKAWRLHLALSTAFIALITPYIIRLYLTPDTVNYDISYALSGRVFYLPFTIMALLLGRLVSAARTFLHEHHLGSLVWLVPLLAYGHALWYYKRSDFLGLNVALQALPEPVPPRWNPYANQQPAWFLLLTLVTLLLLILRVRRFLGMRRVLG